MFSQVPSIDDSSVIKTRDSHDSRFPVFPITIPETPEREKAKPFSVSPCSPVSCIPRSQGLTCKTKLLSPSPLQPQNRLSPKSGDTLEVENAIGHFGSVKRLMHISATRQKAKRPRTGQLQKCSEHISSSVGDDLSEYLQIIRETDNLKHEKTVKGYSRKAEKTLNYSSVSSLSGKIPGNMTSEKRNGATGSITKLSKVHHKISSNEDGKENTPLSTEPCMGLTAACSDYQSDLVESYTSWLCNNDGGEKNENVIICKNEKESKDVKNLGDNEKSFTAAEENFSALDDSWFNDQMEQSFEEPENKKSKLEYVFVHFLGGKNHN